MANVTGIAVFDGMKSWLDKHEGNVIAANTLTQFARTEEQKNEIWADYLKAQKKIGLEYDFMEGKDPQDNASYQEQLMKLGLGEVLSKDTNQDGYVSQEEYIASEAGVEASELDNLGALSDEDYNAVIASLYMHGIIDVFMGNGDDVLEASEFAEFYKNMEQYQGDGTQVRDGVLGFETSSEYPGFLLEQVMG